ncbi:MAG: AMP-binding protein [Candidatus Nanopelagicales bacterium]|nr:AMP-binding protein [Candidatus Nanopelagicales bacterium]
MTVPPGMGGVLKLASVIGPALDGSGPAIAPMADSPEFIVSQTLAALRPSDPDYPLESNDIAIVSATSGSTGTPKGVLLSQQALAASATAFGNRFGTNNRWVVSMPAHRIAGIMVLVRSWFHNSPFEIDPSVGGARTFEAATFAATTMRAVRASNSDGRALMVSLVPTQIARLLESGSVGIEALQSYDLVLSGAAATPQPMLNKMRELGIKVSVSYGMTETCGGCVFDGRPLDGVNISLGTHDDVEPGRVTISGPVTASGYRLRPDLDAVSFISGQVQTHDVGKLDSSGLLHILGRLDDVVTVGGVNVALSAVESLIRHHPAIEDVAVIDLQDELWGSIPIAYVVTRNHISDTANLISEIQSTIRDQISRAAVPRTVQFVTSLPMLDFGKIDRISLRMQAANEMTQKVFPHPGTNH